MNNFDYKQYAKLLYVLVLLQLSSYIVYIYFSFVLNDQFIFGFLGNNSIAVVVSIFFVTALLFAAIFLEKVKHLSADILMLVVAIFSNLLERVYYGGVLDYINFFNVNWFNLADIVIFIIAVKIAYKLIIKSR